MYLLTHGKVVNENRTYQAPRSDASPHSQPDSCASQANASAVSVSEGEASAEDFGLETSDEWSIKAFASSLGVSDAVSRALLHGASVPVGGEFELAKSFGSKRAIEAQLHAGFLVERVASTVWAGVEKLKAAKASTGLELNSKFATNGEAFKGEMGFGGMSEFHGGLEALIGGPLMLNGSLLNAMASEHRDQKDASVPFSTSNGVDGTTSAREWEFVNDPDLNDQERYAERGGDFREAHPDRCRTPMPLEVYEKKMERLNEQLISEGLAPLILEELIGGRLYTGPMYEKYNAVLRFFSVKNPADGSVRTQYASEGELPFLQKKCGSMHLGEWAPSDGNKGGVCWEWHNKYATTIHAINSIVVKMSRSTKVQPLYRGWTDATLPRRFFDADVMGVKGGVEFGFSSTTTEREQAVVYAKGKASTILELEMSMADRGADISWLSMYPHEKETLLPPLMGLQVSGTSVDGNTLVVKCRLSINMASLTLEQVVCPHASAHTARCAHAHLRACARAHARLRACARTGIHDPPKCASHSIATNPSWAGGWQAQEADGRHDGANGGRGAHGSGRAGCGRRGASCQVEADSDAAGGGAQLQQRRALSGGGGGGAAHEALRRAGGRRGAAGGGGGRG